MKVAIVGAGLGGLSAACHLAGRGHEVTVLEREEVPGGRAGVLRLGGYTFDTGPTVLTMPDLLEATFAAAGVDMADLLPLRPVDPMYRATFEDGSTIRLWHGLDRMAEEVRATCGPADADGFLRFAAWVTDLYELEMPHFIARDFDSVLDLARPLGPALRLLRTGGFRRLSKVVGSYVQDERLRRLLSFQSMYAGLAPYEALAIYCVITYMDSVAGVFSPVEGGIHAVPTALAAAAEKAGATFRYGTAVERIRPGLVTLAGGEVVEADAVVCNPDLPVAYRELLRRDPPRPRGRYSPSCLVWHAGVRGELPEGTAHHNIHFGRDWDGAFRAILRDGTRMPDPSILVTVPSLDDPTLATPGGHSLYVLEPVPNLDGRVDWSAERARDELAARVAALGYPAEVEVETIVDPRDWEAQGMERGTPFALSHTFGQTGPFRPGLVDRKVPGVVFVGSGTLPGVGVPMVLVSGRLAAERVEAMAP